MRSGKIIFAKKSNGGSHIRQFHESQLQANDDTIPDDIATNNEELNYDLPTMVTPPRSFME